MSSIAAALGNTSPSSAPHRWRNASGGAPPPLGSLLPSPPPPVMVFWLLHGFLIYVSREPGFFCPSQNTADELGRLVAREASGELNRLAHGYLGRHVLDVEHLVEREAQDGTVDGAHPVDRPADRHLPEPPIQSVTLALDPAH